MALRREAPLAALWVAPARVLLQAVRLAGLRQVLALAPLAGLLEALGQGPPPALAQGSAAATSGSPASPVRT